MQRTIYALQANNNQGKTTTITILHDLMRETGDYTVVKERHRADSKEFAVILSWNGIRIGISTYGDSRGDICRKLDVFVEEHCQVIVCACHEEGATVDTILSYGRYRHVFVPKTRHPNEREHNWCNTLDAGYLLGRLEELIGK